MKTSIVIIGSGQAGVTLAREIRKLDQAIQVTIVSEDAGGFYSKPSLSNAFTKNTDLAKLRLQTHDVLANKTNVTTIPFTAVIGINHQKKELMLQNTNSGTASTLTYDRLVLAVGAMPLNPPIPGIEHSFSINHLEDYLEFRHQLEQQQGKAVAIIGGGLVGCELANDLYHGGYQVTLIERNTELLSGLAPIKMSQALAQTFEKLGINVQLDTNVSQLVAGHSNKSPIRIDTKGTPIEADVVVSALGLMPRLELATKIGLEIDRGIVCNRHLETSKEDIYALGDCVQVEGLVLPYILPIMEGAKKLARTLTDSSATPADLEYPCMPIVVKTTNFPMVLCPPRIGLKSQALRVEETVDGQNIKTLFYSTDERPVGFALAGSFVQERQTLAQSTLGLLDQSFL